MITVNFAQYTHFMTDFLQILEKRFDDKNQNLLGLKKSEIFSIIMEEDFDIAVIVIPDEPFWVARISERDYTHFALKYS